MCTANQILLLTSTPVTSHHAYGFIYGVHTYSVFIKWNNSWLLEQLQGGSLKMVSYIKL